MVKIIYTKDVWYFINKPEKQKSQGTFTFLCKACGNEKTVDKSREGISKYCSPECAKMRFKK